MKNNEFTIKNEFLFFQNEILGDMKKIETKINDRMNKISSILDTQKFLNEKNINELKSMIQNITVKKEEKPDLTQFDNKLKEAIQNMQEQTGKLEIRFNILNKDFQNACFRYDKTISNNLIIPGIIGAGCPYDNLRIFLEYINTKLAELNKDKDKNVLDTKLYKEKLENLIKSNQKQLETIEFKMSDIIRQQLRTSDNLFQDKISAIYNKIEFEKNDNQKVIDAHKNNLDKIKKDFYKFYSNDWSNQNNFVKELNNNIEKNKEQILNLNNKINEIEELIKKMNSNINNSHRRNSCRHCMHKENTNSSELKSIKTNSANDSKIIQKEENKKLSIDNKMNDLSSQKENTKEKEIIEKKLTKNNDDLNQNNEKELMYKNEEQQTLNAQDIAKNDQEQLKDKTNNEYNENLSRGKSRNININEKKDLKRLCNKQSNNDIMKVKNNINENNKVHENIISQYDKKFDNNFNKSFYFKVINYNNIFKERNQLNKTKSEKSPVSHKNEYTSTLEKKKSKKYINEIDNIKFKSLNLGPEFYENEIRFINYSKYNLSQAYLMAKARLEEQQRLKLNIISTTNSNPSGKSLSQNKFKFNRNYNEFQKNKKKEKEKTPDNNLNNLSMNENQEMYNTNFPFINKAQTKNLNMNINEQKMMCSSCVNYNNIYKNLKDFNKDTNNTGIDYNSLNKHEIRKLNILKKFKKENIEDRGGSSDIILQKKPENLTPNNIGNQKLFDSNYVEFSKELSL